MNARSITTDFNGPTEFTFPLIMVAANGFRLDMCKLLLKHDCNVHTYCPNIPMSSSRLYNYIHATGITFCQGLTSSGENSSQFCFLQLHIDNDYNLSFFLSTMYHHCWMDRGSMK